MGEFSRRQALGWGAAAASCTALPRTAFAAPVPQHHPLPGSLDAIARSRGMRFGTATSGSELSQPNLAALIARECSVLVGENAFKWKHLEQREGTYRPAEADAIAAFAANHDMELRGHCLVWSQDNRIPQWQLESEEALAANNGARLIKAIWRQADWLLTRYPAIPSWDVVNEMILPGKGDVRSSLLTRILGEQVMDVAFGIMRAKAPEAQLVYNDYMSWTKHPNHRDGVLRLLEGALKRDVPIDALGIQAHLHGTVAGARDELAWRKFLEEVEGMGLTLLITELDAADRNIASADIAKRDAEVAAHIKGFLDLTLSFKTLDRVLLWSISDRNSYLNRPQYPKERRREDGLPMRGHPFDENLQAKPMRAAIAAALASAPLRNGMGV